MNWIEKIQNKSQAEKLKIIWIVSLITVAVLIVIWIISYRLKKNAPADTTLFKTFSRGFYDLRTNFKK